MPQFFVSKDSISAGKCRIDGADFHHLTRARRAVPGEIVMLRCEDRSLVKAEITGVYDDYLEGDILSREYPSGGSLELTLYAALLKGGGIDDVIRRAVEVGVSRIIPMITERTIPVLKNNREQKVARWVRITEEAAKQSLRSDIPEVGDPDNFLQLIKRAEGVQIIAHPEAPKKFKECPDPPGNRLSIFIGPEGGFSPSEIKAAEEAGIDMYNFGMNHLRAETAGSVIPAIIIYRWS